MLEEKKSFLKKLIPFSMLVYSFFLSRRGGDTKDIISILIMIFVFIYSYQNGIKRYLFYKKEILIGLLYTTLVTFSFIILVDKGEDRLYTFLHATLYSVVFMLVLLNYKLENKYTTYVNYLFFIIYI